jgi:PAS domain S-box-containing protein
VIVAQKAILVVEDDDIVADYLEAALIDLDYAALEPMATGEDAIAQARAQKPDLILMDIELAGEMDGIAAADHIQSFSDVPIIYLTSLSEAPFRRQAGTTPPYGYLVKPVSRQELGATIEMALYRHALDMKLKESDERLKLALASSHMGVWERNLATDEVFWSPECYEIIGLKDFSVTSETFTNWLHPEDAPVMKAAIGRMSTDHPVFRVDFRIIRPDGEVRWLANSGQGYFDEAGVLVRMAGTVQDITDRKHAEEALSRSEERFRSLFETSRDSVLLLNQETGEILEANPVACRTYGYSLEEFLALKITDVSAEPEKTEAAVRQSAPEVPFRLHRKKDGTLFPVEVGGGYFVEGGLRLHTAFIRDITDRKKAEEALKTSEEKYRRLFDDAVLGVFQTSPAGKIFTVNPAYARMFGYSSPDELMAAISDVATSLYADPSRRPSIVRMIEEAHQPICVENVYKRKDGSTFVGSLHAWTSCNSKGELILEGFVEDITERKRAEEDLRTSRLQLADAACMARIAYWESDEATQEFIFNDAFYALYGTTAEQEGGYRVPRKEFVRRFVHPDDQEELRRQVAENRTRPGAGDIEQYEHRAIRRDGEVLHILTRDRVIMDESGQVLRVVGVNQDITARKKMEEALRESETKLRAILDGSRDAIGGASKDGIRTFANPAYVSLFGYESADELIGRPVIDLIAPESRGFIEEMVKRRAAGEPVPSLFEMTALKKDGTTFLMEASPSTYVLKGEQFILSIMRDVTEKKRLEDQLRQAQKMEAVGTLAGGVAHDFNNILTVILGLGNLMQMCVDKDDILKAYVDQIVASSERAADLVQSLLAFSRKQRITLEPCRVNEVVTSTANLLRRLLPEDIGLSVNLTTQDTSILLDVTQIGQVLMNLATNARDAMPHGGSLTIATKRARIDKNFTKTHGFGRPGEYVRLSVSDTGTGMDRETMERIFEPFFTTKEVGKGTGLGLASAYGVVKRHKGYITVCSRRFKGTTFDIYLPLIKTPSRQRAPAKGKIKGGTETILIVEDDRDVRNMLTKVLESHGYTTIEAIDGDDAIRVHQEQKEHIDLIILDVVMPGRNGMEALDEITRTDPLVKAIFVSGYTGDIVIDKGIHREGVDFLHKPLSVTGLLAKVREVLDR